MDTGFECLIVYLGHVLLIALYHVSVFLEPELRVGSTVDVHAAWRDGYDRLYLFKLLCFRGCGILGSAMGIFETSFWRMGMEGVEVILL